MSDKIAPDEYEREQRAAFPALGLHVQHAREPITSFTTANVLRATCLQCGWSDGVNPHDNAQAHVRSFRHAVMVSTIDMICYELANVKDVGQ